MQIPRRESLIIFDPDPGLMKGLQVDDGRNRNRDPLLSGPKSALTRRPLLTMRPFHRCTVVAVVIQRANIGLIMKNSVHGIEIPFPTTAWRQNSCSVRCFAI